MKLLLEKFPMYLDIHVLHKLGFDYNNKQKDCYEVFLLILDENVDETGNMYNGARELIENLAKYMGIEVYGVFQVFLSREEWEESKK